VKNCGKSASELCPEVFGSRITWGSGCGLFEGTRTLDERPEPPSRLCGVLLIIYAIAGSNLGAFNEVAERFLFSVVPSKKGWVRP